MKDCEESYRFRKYVDLINKVLKFEGKGEKY